MGGATKTCQAMGMNAEPDQPLFRPEVAEARKQRLHGEIVLTQPVRTQALVFLLVAIIAIVGAWVVLGRYTRTEVAKGILVTDDASAKIVAMRPGQVTQLLVRDGDLVTPGQRLAAIRVEQSNEAGESAIAGSLTAIELQRGLADQQVRLSGQRAGAERARLSATLAGLRQQRADLAGQIALQGDLVASTQQTFEQIETVVEKGFVSRIEYERRRQAMINARHLWFNGWTRRDWC